jgi:putative nucleotidyltransferase with HDIG domain
MSPDKANSKKSIKVPVEKLAPGMYIDLELSWREHPFMFSKFRIKSAKELGIIKELGLTRVTVYPAKSKIKPETRAEENTVGEATIDLTSTSGSDDKELLWKEKNQSVEQAVKYRYRRQKVSQDYQETIKRVKNLTRDLKTAPANAIRDAHDVVDSIAEAFDRTSEVLVNLVNLSDSGFSEYNHLLNVAVLALNTGSALGFDQHQLRQLGVGALLHDIGKVAVPDKITMKKEPLNESEIKMLQMHPALGGRLARQINQMSGDAIEIIEQHHEFIDGSGYPQGLKAPAINTLSQIVAITNIYDNLCNPADLNNAITPKAAMAILFAKYKNKLDGKLVQTFIQTMGVYPPGTVVRLSDESIGLVVSVDPKELLAPQILLYNPDIPANEALMIDLKSYKDITITEALKPGEYPKRIYDYLGIKERIGYFYEKPNG